jgi:hypothetical protein
MMRKHVFFWLSVIISLIVTTWNLMVLSRMEFAPPMHGSNLWNEFVTDPNDLEEHGKPTRDLSTPTPPRSGPRRRSRTLLGLISSDTANDCSYRRRHRELFQIWNDARVCSLAQLKESPVKYEDCQLVYTFVLGASTEPDAPNLIVNQSLPLYHSPPQKTHCNDKMRDDMTWLNIR